MIFLPTFWCKPEIKKGIFCTPYSLNRFGLWHLHVWGYNRLDQWQHLIYGIRFHFLNVADAYIEIVF
jgi:hypothetical protein